MLSRTNFHRLPHHLINTPTCPPTQFSTIKLTSIKYKLPRFKEIFIPSSNDDNTCPFSEIQIIRYDASHSSPGKPQIFPEHVKDHPAAKAMRSIHRGPKSKSYPSSPTKKSLDRKIPRVHNFAEPTMHQQFSPASSAHRPARGRRR